MAFWGLPMTATLPELQPIVKLELIATPAGTLMLRCYTETGEGHQIEFFDEDSLRNDLGKLQVILAQHGGWLHMPVSRWELPTRVMLEAVRYGRAGYWQVREGL